MLHTHDALASGRGTASVESLNLSGRATALLELCWRWGDRLGIEMVGPFGD